MSQFISPYDRENGYSEINLGLTIVLSVAFHLLVVWVFVDVLPNFLTQRARQLDFITVQLYGALAPAAPAAPADLEVDPNQKGPDVVEVPRSDPALTQPQLDPVTPDKIIAPAEVIPLGPKAPDKLPEIKKTVNPTPKVTPPKVEEPKPKPKPKPKVNPDAAINKRMDELKRKKEADRLDEDIDARMQNLALASGRGEGDSSEQSGSSGTQRIHPDKARYFEHVKDIVSHNWVPPVEPYSDEIRAIYLITIEPSGRIASVVLQQSSGNQGYDLSVERAIYKSNPLPVLPSIFEGRTIKTGLIFKPAELRRGSQRMQ